MPSGIHVLLLLAAIAALVAGAVMSINGYTHYRFARKKPVRDDGQARMAIGLPLLVLGLAGIALLS